MDQLTEMIQIRVNKKVSLADEPIFIDIIGLDPSQKLSLHASIQLDNDVVFESLAHYIADQNGNVDVQRRKSYGGTYEGIWPMGPISSMVPSVLNKRKHERFHVKNPMRPFTVKFCLYNEFISTLEDVHAIKENKALTNVIITRTYARPGVKEYEVSVGRIRGTLYIPPGTGRFPGLLSISGSHPGAFNFKAALLASHGFVTLALRYFGSDDLPKSDYNLDLEYFEEAAIFLKNHPRVEFSRGIGIVANCLGASLSLGITSCAPQRLFACVVAISGWYVCYNMFRYRDKLWDMPSGFTMKVEPLKDGAIIIRGEYPEIEAGNWSNVRKENMFHFHKRHSTAFMFVYGGKDGYHERFIKQVGNHAEKLLNEHNHPKDEIHFYPEAGHLIEHAYYPHAQVAYVHGQYQWNGGERPGHSMAQEDSWPKILSFVRSTLCHPQAQL